MLCRGGNLCVLLFLSARRWLRFAGGERGSRLSQVVLNTSGERVRATEDAPRGPSRVLVRRHSLAEIDERGGRVLDERLKFCCSTSSDI